MVYDSIRITGLSIGTSLNKNLINLSANPTNPEAKLEVLKSLVYLCNNSMLLKQTDKHLTQNINHFQYSNFKFADIIDQA